ARAHGFDRQRSRGGVVAVRTHREAQPFAQGRLRLRPELRVASPLLGARPVVEDQLGLTMEPVGGPVGRHVAAVTPDGADFHSSQGLPDRLTALDGAIGHDDAPVRRDDALRDGRHVLVDAAADPAQHGKAEDHHDRQHDPESFHTCLRAASVAWTSRTRSTSTFVFSTVPPRPRMACRITSMSPSRSRTKRADVPGFITRSTSLTKPSPIPAHTTLMAVPAPPTIAPIAAPTNGRPSTRPARKPTAEAPRMFELVGKRSRSRLKDPSRCRTTIITSSRSRRLPTHPRRTISSRT